MQKDYDFEKQFANETLTLAMNRLKEQTEVTNSKILNSK